MSHNADTLPEPATREDYVRPVLESLGSVADMTEGVAFHGSFTPDGGIAPNFYS